MIKARVGGIDEVEASRSVREKLEDIDTGNAGAERLRSQPRASKNYGWQ
jgi:hypothetical protein